MRQRRVAVDSNALTYLLDAVCDGYLPGADPDPGGSERVAMFRVFCYLPERPWVGPTVRVEYAAIVDASKRDDHDRWTRYHLEDVELTGDAESVDARVKELKKHHCHLDDCREAEGGTMPKFVKGISGNLLGRPRQAAGLREHLEQLYGADGRKLVGRLERLSRSRNHRVALESVRLLLSYLAGTPQQSFELTGRFEHRAYQELSPDALSRLTGAQLDVLRQLNPPESFEAPDQP
jgi:hypothetical protein